MKHYNIIVIGKVQGVFYRQSALDIANELGLYGFVQNELNGNVYIEAEGTEMQLEKFINWCRNGPPRAVVHDVKFSEGKIQDFSSFSISR